MEEMELEHENDVEDQELKIGSSCSIEGICDEPQSSKQLSYNFDYEHSYSTSFLNHITSI